METEHPFLCLAVYTQPLALQRSDFSPKGSSALLLTYSAALKSFVMLTLPDFCIINTIQCRIFDHVFPRQEG